MKKKYVLIGVSLLTCSVTIASCSKSATTPEAGTTTSVQLGQEDNKATVSFNVDGGSEVESIEVTKGDKIEAPVTSKQSTLEYTYTFAGWYTDSSFSTLFDFDSNIVEDTTIYAKWSN